MLENTQVARAQRIRTIGKEHVYDQRGDTSLGRARILGMFKESFYRAGMEFLAIDRLHRLCHGYAPLWPRSIDIRVLARTTGQDNDVWPLEEVARIISRKEKADYALDTQPVPVRVITRGVVLEDQSVTDSNLNELRLGLQSLRNHFFGMKASANHPDRTVLVWHSDNSIPSIDKSLWEPTSS